MPPSLLALPCRAPPQPPLLFPLPSRSAILTAQHEAAVSTFPSPPLQPSLRLAACTIRFTTARASSASTPFLHSIAGTTTPPPTQTTTSYTALSRLSRCRDQDRAAAFPIVRTPPPPPQRRELGLSRTGVPSSLPPPASDFNRLEAPIPLLTPLSRSRVASTAPFLAGHADRIAEPSRQAPPPSPRPPLLDFRADAGELPSSMPSSTAPGSVPAAARAWLFSRALLRHVFHRRWSHSRRRSSGDLAAHGCLGRRGSRRHAGATSSRLSTVATTWLPRGAPACRCTRGSGPPCTRLL